MKRFELILAFFLIPFGLTGQNQKELNNQNYNQMTHSFGDINVSISPDILFNAPHGIQPGGGLKLRMFISKRFSFDGDLLVSRDYVHFGLGLIGIPIWIMASHPGISSEQDFTFKELIAMGACMLLSAEHTSYHIPLGNYMDISPYVSLLRIKTDLTSEHKDTSDDKEYKLAFVTGLELNKYFNRFIFSPYVEYYRCYNGYNSGINLGLYFGLYFPAKK